MLILKADPRLGVGIFALAFARQATLPAVGVEHRPRGVPIHFAEITFDMSENVLVVFHDVAICVDNEFRHSSLPKFYSMHRWICGFILTIAKKDFSLRSK